jgi:hypothetical protein
MRPRIFEAATGPIVAMTPPARDVLSAAISLVQETRQTLARSSPDHRRPLGLCQERSAERPQGRTALTRETQDRQPGGNRRMKIFYTFSGAPLRAGRAACPVRARRYGRAAWAPVPTRRAQPAGSAPGERPRGPDGSHGVSAATSHLAQAVTIASQVLISRVGAIGKPGLRFSAPAYWVTGDARSTCSAFRVTRLSGPRPASPRPGAEYFLSLSSTPEYVAMYLPGDAVLQPAHDHDHDHDTDGVRRHQASADRDAHHHDRATADRGVHLDPGRPPGHSHQSASHPIHRGRNRLGLSCQVILSASRALVAATKSSDLALRCSRA